METRTKVLRLRAVELYRTVIRAEDAAHPETAAVYVVLTRRANGATALLRLGNTVPEFQPGETKVVRVRLTGTTLDFVDVQTQG